jgi:hypothetical protein
MRALALGLAVVVIVLGAVTLAYSVTVASWLVVSVLRILAGLS